MALMKEFAPGLQVKARAKDVSPILLRRYVQARHVALNPKSLVKRNSQNVENPYSLDRPYRFDRLFQISKMRMQSE